MKMRYKSGGDSGVISYEMVGDAIILEFVGGGFRYVYNEVSPGAEYVMTMKRLAEQGSGLSTYVSRIVRERYASKIPTK
jgi:hypothetical protein